MPLIPNRPDIAWYQRQWHNAMARYRASRALIDTDGFLPGTPGAAPSPPVINSVGIMPSSGNVGDLFFATASVAGSPVPDLTYDWSLDGSPIAGATSSSWLADAAGSLEVAVSASNSEGSDGPVTSAPVTVSVAPIAPTVTNAAISPASGSVGDTFTASATVGGDPVPGVVYEWFLDGAPVGADQTTHVPAGPGALTVTITGTNVAGSDFDTAAATVNEALTAPANITPPTIAGTPEVGATLTRTNGTWSGNPTPTVTGNWQRDTVNIGQTGPTYTVAPDDDLTAIRWREAAQNSEGTSRSNSNELSITYPAPTAAGAISDKSYTQNSVATYDASGDFTGTVSTWSITAGAATVDSSGLITFITSGLLTNDPVTVRAENSGGAATQSFNLSVVEETGVFGFVAENGTDQFVAENGTDTFIQEAA